MKTYSTYQEAKIASPTEDIYFNGAFKWFGCNSPDVFNVCLVKCNPADYCMTIERFLSDGNKFVDGDIVIDALGCVYIIPCRDCDSWNEKSCMDCERYILRAAALEPKKPRTRVEYVKCDFDSIFELRQDFELGELYFAANGDAKNMRVIDTELHLVKLLQGQCLFTDRVYIYRKVETEIDERQEFIDAAYYYFQTTGLVTETLGKMFDSGKFKYIGGGDADK